MRLDLIVVGLGLIVSGNYILAEHFVSVLCTLSLGLKIDRPT
jgi:hypothetical protein